MSMSLHHQAFFEIFQDTLGKLDEINKNGEKVGTKNIICDLIEFHIAAKG